MAKLVVPSDADANFAIEVLLRGVASGRRLTEIAGDLAQLHPRNNMFPGEVMLEVAADAMPAAERTAMDARDLCAAIAR